MPVFDVKMFTVKTEKVGISASFCGGYGLFKTEN